MWGRRPLETVAGESGGSSGWVTGGLVGIVPAGCLGVKASGFLSRHVRCTSRCLLYPQKRTCAVHCRCLLWARSRHLRITYQPVKATLLDLFPDKNGHTFTTID